MAKKFKVGDRVKWNSEAGRVSGTIISIHTGDFNYKGHVRHARRTILNMKSRATRPTISRPIRAARSIMRSEGSA
jgi:transcription elongation GreA/GreB family factor